MRVVCSNLVSLALLACCTFCQTFGVNLAANEDSDAACLIQWQVATDSDRPKKRRTQKLENFNCGDYAWCSGLKNTMQKVTEITELTKKAPANSAVTNSAAEEILEPLTHEEEKVVDLHRRDDTSFDLDEAQDDLGLSEVSTAEKEEARRHEIAVKQAEKEEARRHQIAVEQSANDAAVAKWKRFSTKLTKEKQTLKTTVDGLKAENEMMKENLTKMTRSKEQAQEVAIVIANQWQSNARTLTNTNKELLANITRLTAEKQQILGELEKASSDKQRVVMEKDEAAVNFQRSHESDHSTLQQWKRYADRLTNEKQQLNAAIAKLSSEKTNLESTITSFNQPEMPMEDNSKDTTKLAHNVAPASTVMPIMYAQQP